MESVSGSEFTFVNGELDSYLDDLASKLEVPSKEPRACALTHLGTSEPAKRQLAAYSTSVTREFEGPKSISCFDYEIKLSSTVVNSIKTTFAQEPCGLKNVQILTNLRFPPKLKTCYVKNYDFEKECLELARGKKPKSRRKPRRTRFSLSENVHVNDDNYRRSNVLPTDDDLRSAYDKVFPCRAVPYIFGCEEKSNLSHDCAKRCSEKVEGFRLFVEIPQDGRPVHPVVAENLAGNEGGVVDDILALVAVTAVRTPTPPTSRVFVPVSQDLADKIGVLSEVFDVDDEPLVDDPEVCRVVEDIVEFVDRQSDFPDLDFDPDASPADDSFTLDGSKDDDALNLNDVCPSEDSNSTSPAKIDTKIRKKKRVEKNRVVRELKKLLNISVKDEEEPDSNLNDDSCDEPTCVLGCVCTSLSVKPPPVEHCGQSGCIFKCSCSEKKYFYVSEGDLAKEEKAWHQTVVRKKGNAVELQSGFERSKRQSKLPSKYENSFTGQHFDHVVRTRRKPRDRERFDEELEAELDKLPSNGRTRRRRGAEEPERDEIRSTVESPVDTPDEVFAPKIKWKENTNQKRSESLKKKCEEIKKDMLNSRLTVCGTDKVKTLDQVFIWCTIHDKYDCHCSNYIVMTRNSNLLVKAARTNRYTAKKMFSKKRLKTTESPENRIVKLWDEKHCARSVGAVVNYPMRNKTGVYKRMMKRVLLEQKVCSFSNGYIKTRPVATIQPEELYDSVPLSGYPCSGVGTVSHGPTGKKLLVGNVCTVPDTLELSEPEDLSRTGSDFMDASSEIVPMPRKRRSSDPETCLSFSLFGTSAPKRPPKAARRPSPITPPSPPSTPSTHVPAVEDIKPEVAPTLIDDNTPVQFDAESAESDVEFIEEPMEVLSIKSSSEDEAGPDHPDDESKSSISESQALVAPSHSQMSHDSVKSIQVESPITIESDEDSATAADEDEDVSLPDEGATVEDDPTMSPAPPSLQAASVSNENIEDEEEYPMFGLCNLKHKDFGYIPLLDTSGTRLQIQIPFARHCSRTFSDAKEASRFMVTLVDKYFGLPRTGQFGEWCKVTRGVLKKLNVKRFPNPELLPELEAPKSKRSPTQTQAPHSTTPDKKKPKVTIENEKQLIRPFPLTRPQKESSSATETVKESAASEKTAREADIPASDVPAPPVNLVGTFPNMSEANSFIQTIQKTFPSIIQAPPVKTCPRTTYTALKSITTPGGSGPTASPNPAPRAVLPVVKGKSMLVPASVLATRFPGVKVPISAPGYVRMPNGQMLRCTLVQQTTGQVASSNSSVKSVTTSQPTALTTAPIRIVLPPTQQIVGPVRQPLRLTTPGMIHLRAPQAVPATTKTVRPICPRADLPPIRVRPPPRRAEVIVARDTGYATVIAPTPPQTPPILPKTAPVDKVLYSGVLIAKPDAPKIEPGKGAVICSKTATTNYKSLLPQKSPPKLADQKPPSP